MAKRIYNWAELGKVINKGNQFIANVDTTDLGARYHTTGPPRTDRQQAAAVVVFLRATLALSRDSGDEIEAKGYTEALEELDQRLSSGDSPGHKPW